MRPVHPAVALAALALVAAACGSSGNGGGEPSTPSSPQSQPESAQPSTVTATVTTTATTSRSVSAPGSSTQAKGWCTESQLRASIDPRHIPGNGTPGSGNVRRHGVLVDFENTSNSACVLYGYPGAAVVDKDGAQVTQAKRTLRGPLGGLPQSLDAPPRVRLGPGDFASAMVEGLDQRDPGAAQAGCDAPKYPRILITPPNTRIPVPFSVGWPQCYSFTIHPVRALPDPPPR